MNIVRLLVFGLFTAHAFGAAYIDPVLRDLIESKVERRIRVLVVLPEIPPMPASVSAAEQILARQREVRRQHKPLLKALAELKGSFMESLWISNTISLEILSSQLPKIAAMGDVLRIEENQEIIQDDLTGLIFNPLNLVPDPPDCFQVFFMIIVSEHVHRGTSFNYSGWGHEMPCQPHWD